MKLEVLSEIKDLPNGIKNKWIGWTGHGQSMERIEAFKRRFGFIPKIIYRFKNQYFTETNILIEV